jgi:hypothetical protein
MTWGDQEENGRRTRKAVVVSGLPGDFRADPGGSLETPMLVAQLDFRNDQPDVLARKYVDFPGEITPGNYLGQRGAPISCVRSLRAGSEVTERPEGGGTSRPTSARRDVTSVQWRLHRDVASHRWPRRGRWVFPGQRLCDLTGALDETLNDRAWRAAFQRDDSNRPARSRQFDWQFPDEGMAVGKAQPELRHDSEVAARPQQIGSHFQGSGHDGRAREIEAAGAKSVHHDRSKIGVRRRQCPQLPNQVAKRDPPSVNPRILVPAATTYGLSNRKSKRSRSSARARFLRNTRRSTRRSMRFPGASPASTAT